MLFEEQIARKPDLYPWTKDFISKMWAGHWTPNEFNFQSDLQQFKTQMTPDEQEVVVRALSAIGQIEIAVKKFWGRLGDNLPHPSISDLGLTMSNIEVIHNIAYEKLLTVLGLEDVFEKNLKLEVVQNRVKYLRKYLQKNYTDDKKQYVYALILFTLFVENVSLFSQFYTVMWFNRFNNVLKDTAQQIQYTKNEELIHALVGIKLVNTIRDEYPELFDAELEQRIAEEAREAFAAESKIVDWIMANYTAPGLTPEILKEFIKHRINDSLEQIGFAKVFDVDVVLLQETQWFEEEIYANAMTDFFHKRPVEYAKKHTTFNEEDIF